MSKRVSERESERARAVSRDAGGRGHSWSKAPGEMREAWSLCEGMSSNKTQGYFLVVQESREKGTCEDGIFEVEKRNAFFEVCLYLLLSCYVLVLFIYSVNVYSISVWAVHSARCQEFTEQRPGCCPKLSHGI